MSFLTNAGLYTDFYELTMAQAFFYEGKKEELAVFDYFYRDNPFNGGYVLFAGLKEVLEVVSTLSFSKEDLEYLASLGFKSEFLAYLSTFRFTGNLFSVQEGEVIFPLTPVLSVEAPIIEAQIIETLLLNILNFSSLVATKASRIRFAAGHRTVIDFGMRRAQGLGSLYATSAAFIGGVHFTSNVKAASILQLPLSGTMAHSWIQSFDDERSAFMAYAEQYPDQTVLLVDTYDTLKSGIPNAIHVARVLKEQGHALKAIRIDSGDLAYLSRNARKMLDQAGFEEVKIAVSNQLDEYIIKSLIDQGAPIDIFGVGTRLVIGHDDGALDGVYKLSRFSSKPRIKISENVAKINFPDAKRLYRISNSHSDWVADAITLAGEKNIKKIFHPYFPEKNIELTHHHLEPLLHTWIKKGSLTQKLSSISEASMYAQQRLNRLPPEYRRFEYPHEFKVGISKKLLNLQRQLLETYRKK